MKSVSTQLIACSCYSGGGWEENTDCGIVGLAEDNSYSLCSSPTWGHAPSLSPQLFCHRWNNCPSTAAKQGRYFLSVPQRPSQCVLCSASQQLLLSLQPNIQVSAMWAWTRELSGWTNLRLGLRGHSLHRCSICAAELRPPTHVHPEECRYGLLTCYSLPQSRAFQHGEMCPLPWKKEAASMSPPQHRTKFPALGQCLSSKTWGVITVSTALLTHIGLFPACVLHYKWDV